MAHDSLEQSVSNRLQAARLWSYFVLFWERISLAILPFASIIALFLIVSWFGLFRTLPDWARLTLGIGFIFAGLSALLLMRKIRFANLAEIDRRIEYDNKLIHQPISTQDDQPIVGNDTFGITLWVLHQKQLAQQISHVSGTKARSFAPDYDPWALRTIIPLLLVTAYTFSYGNVGGSVNDIFQSHEKVQIIPARIDAWITPPSYTDVAPIFITSNLNAERNTFTAPEGSKITVRISGGENNESISFPDNQTTLIPLENSDLKAKKSARQFEVTAHESGALEIATNTQNIEKRNLLNKWSITIVDDTAPKITFSSQVERALNGAMTLRYIVTDDYRIASGKAQMTLSGKTADNARSLYNAPEVSLSLPRKNADGKAKTTINLSEHPWAGAEVNITLQAKDDLEQKGVSKTITTTLPSRPFTNRLARALIEQRRILALDANKGREVYEMLGLFMLYPEETLEKTAHFLGLATAQAKLRYANNDDDLRAVVDYLWEIARVIEDGGLSDAERRLKEAQQALRDALERGASDKEIEQAMNELRKAMQEFMREFAQQNQNNPNMQAPQGQQNIQELDQQSLDEMLDRLEEMAKSGARQQAMDMLSQLQDMMNNLQLGQQQNGQEQSNQAQQQMNELGEILRQQQELMNDTFEQNQRQSGQGETPQQGPQGQDNPSQGNQNNGQSGTGQNGIQDLAPNQHALRNRLNEFIEGLEGMGINPGEEFGQANRSMDQAGEALGDGSGEQALNDQGNAMDALRRGADSMMRQMQQQAGQGQAGGTQNGEGRDPLGRPQRSSGPDFGNEVKVPDEIDVRRAREILEAIRKRLGNGTLKQLEKDYLERLLELN